MKLAIYFIAFFILSACSQKIISEKPVPGQFGTPPPEIESAFEIPVSIPINDLNAFVDAQIPQNIYSGTEKGTQTMTVNMLVGKINQNYNWEVNYSVVKSGKISLSIDKEGVLWFKIPLKVKAEGCASVIVGTEIKKCGNSQPEIDLLIKSKIQVNPDWTFSSKTTIAYDLRSAVLNIPFQLGNFPLFQLKLDIKDDLQKPMNQQLNFISGQIDSYIIKYLNDMKIKEIAAKYWSDYSTSIKFSDNPPVFVNIQPRRIGFSDLYRNKNLIESKIAVYGIVGLSSQPVEIVKTALPNVEKFIPSKGVAINLPVHIDYKTLEKVLMDNFADTTLSGSGYKFSVKGVKMYGSGKYVMIELKYQAKVVGIFKKITGVMYFKTVPAFDILTNTFYLDECQLSSETNSALADKSLNKFANKTLTKTIIKLTTYPVDKDIDKLKTSVNDYIKNFKAGKLIMQGEIERIDFVGFYIEPEMLNIYLRASGTIETTLDLKNK